MDPKSQAKPNPTEADHFCRLVLEIIEEQSPCSQSTLFMLAISRGLPSFGGGSLAEYKRVISQCVRVLTTRGLVRVDGVQLVPARARGADEVMLGLAAEVEHKVEDILELTPEFVLHEVEDILELTPELELHDIDDILDLTPELELRPSLPSSKPDEQLIDQTSKVGRKGAPEPEREEIIAAMRRFISDD